MMPKYLLVMISVCVALHPGKTNADTSIILQDFEDIIFDFFERYSNNTAGDTSICKASVPETIINKESFEKSDFYKQYVAGHSKCEEKQCSAVDYELQHRVKIEKRIAEEDNSTTKTTTIENGGTTVTDTNTENEETTLVTDTSTGNEETTQVTDTSTGNGLETTESGRNATESEHGTAENSKWENNDGTTSHNGKKTTVIVVSTMAAVATTAAAAVYGVPWIKAILQSGAYRFPATPGV